MVLGWKGEKINIRIENEDIDQVGKLKYLSVSSTVIKVRIAVGKGDI